MNKQITTGSRAFFSGMEGFQPKDKDIVVLIDKSQANGFEWMRQTSNGSVDLFEIVNRPKAELIAHAVEKAKPMAIARFLTPAFAEAIGLQVEDLKELKPMRQALDAKHAYLGIIFDAYVETDSFALSGEQRQSAYDAYKAARPATDRSSYRKEPLLNRQTPTL